MKKEERERLLKHSNLLNVPIGMFIEIEDEIRASTTREIRLYRSVHGSVWLNINFGTKIKVPYCRPPKEVGYTNKAYKVMEFMGLIRPADGGAMSTQEQIDWIKTCCVHGFKKL